MSEYKIYEELEEAVGKLILFSNSEGLSSTPVKELESNSPEGGLSSSESKS
jgi:hypothetical protein